MKRIFLTTAAIAIAAVGMSNQCRAAIESYANINISDFAVYNDAGGGALGTIITEGVEVDVIVPSFTSGASGNVLSIPGGPVATAAAAADPTGLNTLQAFEGAGVPPAQNDFSNYTVPPGTAPFARGDTDGAGAIIAGLGFSTPASVQLVAETQLTTSSGGFDIGQAASNAASSALFDIIVGPGGLAAVFDLNISRSLLVDLIPGPPGVLGSSDTSFNISITNAVGALVFSWVPNGVVDPILGGTEIFDPFDPNGSISGIIGTTVTDTDPLANFRATASLAPGRYSITINTQTQVDATRVESSNIIPEPMSIATWSLLSGIGVAVWARRRRGANA